MPTSSKAQLRADLEAARTRADALILERTALTALVEAQRAITASLDSKESLRTIVDRAGAIVGETDAWLYEFDEATQTLQCLVATQMTAAEIDSLRFRTGEGFTGQVAATRRPLAVSDTRGDARLIRPSLAVKYGHVSYLGIPVVLGDRLLGVLAFNSSRLHEYSPHEIRLLTAFADQVAVALENARLYNSVRRELEERRRAEGALRESEERYHRLLDAVTDYTYHIRVENGWPVETMHGPGCLRVTGYTPEDLRQDAYLWIRMVDPLDQPAVKRHAEALLAGEAPPPLEHRILRKDGSRRWVCNTVVRQLNDQGTLVAFDGLIQDITERKEAEVLLAEHAQHLETVRVVGAEMVRELDLSAVLRLILRRALALTGAMAGGVMLWDEKARALVPHAWEGHGEWFGEIRWRLGEGVAGTVAETRRGMKVDDYRTSPCALPILLERTTMTAVLSEPLLYRDRLLGVLNVDRGNQAGPFGRQDQAILALLADQAAIAIENARLHSAATRKGEELEALLRASRTVMAGLDLQENLGRILQEASRISGAPHVKVLLVDREAGLLRVGALQGSSMAADSTLPLGVGSSGIVAQTGESLFMADAQNDPRSVYAEADRALGVVTYLGLPIKRGNEVLGVLTFNTTAPRDYSREEMAYLTAFADHAAIAIENARLFQEELQRRQQLEAVRTVSAEITRELDVGVVLRVISRRARELVGGDGSRVWLRDEASDGLLPMMWEGVRDLTGFRLGLGEGVVGEVARRRTGMIVNDYLRSPYAHETWIREGESLAVMAEPLLYHDRLLGVISISREGTERPFREGDRNALRLLADHTAIAIENARLYQATQRRTRQLEALLRGVQSIMAGTDLEATLKRIVSEAAGISQCPRVRLYLVDAEERVLRLATAQGAEKLGPVRSLPLDGTTLSGITAVTAAPVFSADVQTDPRNPFAQADSQDGMRTHLSLPVKTGEDVLGVLTFTTFEPRLYSEDEMAYLASFADQAALAIEKAQFIAKLQESYRDLQRTQDELVRGEKLRGLGQMAAGIAHELNNILAAILGQVELLKLRTTEPQLRETLDMLDMAATDGAQVVRRLQDFARQRPAVHLLPVRVAQLIQEALNMTRPHWHDEALRRGVVVRVETEVADLPPILGSAGEIREALTNLILNAVDAMPEGGSLTVSARLVIADEERSAVRRDDGTGGPEPPNRRTAEPPTIGEYVEIVVADSGVGMTEEVRRHIFDPFFTTKGVSGTGLGLSVVYGIVERHKGTIQVASAPGAGTTVRLRFRPTDREILSAPSASTRRPVPVVPQRILLVDDDRAVREALGSLLRAMGHTVIEADGGAAGLTALATAPVDLVLTDLGMPEITGWDVARAVKAERSRLPVILLTGWGERVGDETEAASLVDRILGKPVGLDDLLNVIAELTGGG